jgi:hypothetical protein
MAWYYLRVPGCGTLSAVRTHLKEIEKVGKVYECDIGTEVDHSAGWYTVNVNCPTVQSVRERLRDLGISGHVDHIEALMKARDGRAASRQLGLF